MSKLPRLFINTNLKSEDGKIYNAYYKDFRIILTPIIQRPSGRLTYVWKQTHQHHSEDSDCFDSAKQALANAVEVLS